MIQRIQTVYLFLAFCLMAAVVFVPFSPSGVILSTSGTVAVLALITIFLYKKRRLQINMCYVMLLLSVLVYAFYFIFDRQNLSRGEFFPHLQSTFVFPFIAIIFLYLAIRGIKKDEKLIRSLDRLR
ncbi:MAG: DUF4293 domain-containing protein [Candidatus Azobacteroides sp.]|nr:DUF4293 domain-containing protein [Candidatus Azobacteroides sp.]